MQIIITDNDLREMPNELRSSLLRYLAGTARQPREAGAVSVGASAFRYAPFDEKGAAGKEAYVVLDRVQALGLLREVSFGRDQKALRTILKKLAYGKLAEAPTVQDIAKAVRGSARNVQSHLKSITGIVRRLTGDQTANLYRLRSDLGTYELHPATRRALRQVMDELVHAGEGEEVLWE